VTCYFRRLKEIFKKAGIEVTSENKREVTEPPILNPKSSNARLISELWIFIDRINLATVCYWFSMKKSLVVQTLDRRGSRVRDMPL
jgi:hypothetical protein